MREIVLKGRGKNALGSPVMERAITDFGEAKGEAVLLRGDGDAFSAGLDLKELLTLDPPGMTRYLGLLDQLIVTILRHDAPVVAFVNGHAIAGGCVLALACDARITLDDESLRIGLNEVPIGLVFPPRVLKLARARLAPSHAQRVLLEGGLYPPSEAYRLGLVHEVSVDAEARAKDYLQRLAASPSAAFGAAKRELNRPILTLETAELEAFAEDVLPRWSSPDLKTTIEAVLAKKR